MPILRLSLLVIFILVLTACGQQQEQGQEQSNQTDDQPENEEASSAGGGIVAGSLETTLEVNEQHAIFKIKNQTEQVKELIMSGKTKYEYVIADDEGETVFQTSQSKPQYEQKHPIVLKQAEEIEYKLAIPNDLKPGTYFITAVLHTKPVLKAKTKFIIKQ